MTKELPYAMDPSSLSPNEAAALKRRSKSTVAADNNKEPSEENRERSEENRERSEENRERSEENRERSEENRERSEENACTCDLW
jgi:hypothetical protein